MGAGSGFAQLLCQRYFSEKLLLGWGPSVWGSAGHGKKVLSTRVVPHPGP
jgi:hypothetical protein